MEQESSVWLSESPISMIEGETITYNIIYLDATQIGLPSVIVYMDGDDVTSTVMPTGEHSISGNSLTLKPLTACNGDGGNKYVLVIQAVVDGNTERRKLQINVLRENQPGDE